MTSENLCNTAGCPDLCCRQVDLILSQDEWSKFAAVLESMEVYIQEVDIKRITSGFLNIRDIQHNSDGVYYARKSNQIYVHVKGDCPLLNENGCSIYNHSSRPKACSSFTFGGRNCTNLREDFGFISVKDIEN